MTAGLVNMHIDRSITNLGLKVPYDTYQAGLDMDCSETQKTVFSGRGPSHVNIFSIYKEKNVTIACNEQYTC